MSNTHCPACGQRIVQQARRVCADCQKPIGGHHKWFFGADGRARHRVCEQPTDYVKGPTQTPPMIEALTERPGSAEVPAEVVSPTATEAI